jgi:sec-independent protein translocase protein TatB
MFDIGWGELVVIGVVALIVIGPKELPTVLRTLGQAMGKVRRMANEFQGQFQEALREAELHDLKKHADDLTSGLSESMNEFTSFDPLEDSKQAIEHSFDSVPNTDAVTEAAAPVAESASETSAAENAAPAAVAEVEAEKPAIEAPPAPVAQEDFAAAEPPAKPAGGSA